MSLDQITPATQAVDASPSDVLAVAFPKHGRMVDPAAGVWIYTEWYSDATVEYWNTLTLDLDDQLTAVETTLAVDVIEHLHVNEDAPVHPEDLPACLPTRQQMLDDVMHHPAEEIAAALAATRSTEPGKLLAAMAETAS